MTSVDRRFISSLVPFWMKNYEFSNLIFASTALDLSYFSECISTASLSLHSGWIRCRFLRLPDWRLYVFTSCYWGSAVQFLPWYLLFEQVKGGILFCLPSPHSFLLPVQFIMSSLGLPGSGGWILYLCCCCFIERLRLIDPLRGSADHFFANNNPTGPVRGHLTEKHAAMN